MRAIAIPWAAALAAIPLGSCQDTTLAPSQALAPCRALVAAKPAEWRTRWPKAHQLGASASSTLVECLREHPEGPGRQAAIHLLGVWRNREAGPYLRQVLTDGSADATDQALALITPEAAVALGALGDRAAIPVLVATVRDQDRATTTRTAAAGALLDLGHIEDAVPLLQAVLLAATPYGQELEQHHGLPEKTRWAFERNLAIEAIRRFTGGKTFGLDEDAPWPTLSKGVAGFLKYVEDHRRSGS